MILPSLSLIYSLVVKARNRFYESGFLESFSLGAPTFSVGNITAGGTGKTPLVAFIAEILIDSGEKVCILTRGYGRENPEKRVLVSDGETFSTDAGRGGDEPVELARKLDGKAVIVADKNRAEAGRWALEKFNITAFILDDGFQHLRVRRDLNIVCIDSTNPFGNGKLLPKGILREPLRNLKRADAIVITRANLSENIEKLKIEIAEHNKDCPIFISCGEFSNLTEIEDFHKNQTSENHKSKIINQKSLAFCALGNPKNFFEQLEAENFKLTATEAFHDHHFYTQKDVENLETKAKRQNIINLLTTVKDAVKLAGLKFTMPCYVLENKLVFENESRFRRMIREKIRR
jgi:tetraacyldisaccharide 4'-kinase